MQWDASAHGGFTTGAPWLAAVDPARRSVAAQRADAESLHSLHRRLVELRRGLRGGLELVCAESGGLLAYRRGDVLVVLNLGTEPVRPAAHPPIGASGQCQFGEAVLATHGAAADGTVLAPGAGAVFRTA
jgi:alpha-glucosidase